MEFNKQKYEFNEKLLLRIGFSLLVASVVLIFLTILVIDSSEFIVKIIEVLSIIGLIASAVIVVTGNVRILRFLLVVMKKDKDLSVWKSVVSVILGLMSLTFYWFTLLLILLDNF